MPHSGVTIKKPKRTGPSPNDRICVLSIKVQDYQGLPFQDAAVMVRLALQSMTGPDGHVVGKTKLLQWEVISGSLHLLLQLQGGKLPKAGGVRQVTLASLCLTDVDLAAATLRSLVAWEVEQDWLPHRLHCCPLPVAVVATKERFAQRGHLEIDAAPARLELLLVPVATSRLQPPGPTPRAGEQRTQVWPLMDVVLSQHGLQQLRTTAVPYSLGGGRASLALDLDRGPPLLRGCVSVVVLLPEWGTGDASVQCPDGPLVSVLPGTPLALLTLPVMSAAACWELQRYVEEAAHARQKEAEGFVDPANLGPVEAVYREHVDMLCKDLACCLANPGGANKDQVCWLLERLASADLMESAAEVVRGLAAAGALVGGPSLGRISAAGVMLWANQVHSSDDLRAARLDGIAGSTSRRGSGDERRGSASAGGRGEDVQVAGGPSCGVWAWWLSRGGHVGATRPASTGPSTSCGGVGDVKAVGAPWAWGWPRGRHVGATHHPAANALASDSGVVPAGVFWSLLGRIRGRDYGRHVGPANATFPRSQASLSAERSTATADEPPIDEHWGEIADCVREIGLGPPRESADLVQGVAPSCTNAVHPTEAPLPLGAQLACVGPLRAALLGYPSAELEQRYVEHKAQHVLLVGSWGYFCLAITLSAFFCKAMLEGEMALALVAFRLALWCLGLLLVARFAGRKNYTRVHEPLGISFYCGTAVATSCLALDTISQPLPYCDWRHSCHVVVCIFFCLLVPMVLRLPPRVTFLATWMLVPAHVTLFRDLHDNFAWIALIFAFEPLAAAVTAIFADAYARHVFHQVQVAQAHGGIAR